jgi:hypothetical protein
MSLHHADSVEALYERVRALIKRDVKSQCLRLVLTDDPINLAVFHLMEIDRKAFLRDILREIADEICAEKINDN